MAFEIAEAEADLAFRASASPAQLLAVRRAALTLYYHAAESCDDSYGALGDVAPEAIKDCAGVVDGPLLAPPAWFMTVDCQTPPRHLRLADTTPQPPGGLGAWGWPLR